MSRQRHRFRYWKLVKESKKVKMIYIGIDPGVHNGWARWDSRNMSLKEYRDMDFWTLIEELRASHAIRILPRMEFTVIIEDPGLNKPVFPKKGAQKFGAVQRVAQNVGMNKAYARLIIEYCEKYGIAYEAVKPSTKKWDAAMFRAVTGIKGRVSQHVRDAVKLVWGRI